MDSLILDEDEYCLTIEFTQTRTTDMRIPIPSVEDLSYEGKNVVNKILASREKVPTLFQVLAYTPKVLERREAYGKALREDTILDPKLRELAICNVARLNGGGYELVAHERLALAAGCSQNQIDALGDFETALGYTDQERAVLRYAGEVTTNIRVSDSTWAACEAFLPKRELVELVLICAWYNQTARITWPLQLTDGGDGVQHLRGDGVLPSRTNK